MLCFKNSAWTGVAESLTRKKRRRQIGKVFEGQTKGPLILRVGDDQQSSLSFAGQGSVEDGYGGRGVKQEALGRGQCPLHL